MILRVSLASILLATAVTSAVANPPAAPTAGQRIAVVDVARIFKNHRRFNQELELLKKDAETFQAMIRSEQEKLQTRVDAARAEDPSSATFRAAESELTTAMGALQVSQRQKGRDLAEKEARLYFNTYLEVSNAIASYADNSGINLVLKFNSEPIDPQNPKSILEGVNREVMLQVNRDITDLIIAQVNAGQAAPATATRPQPAPAPNR